LQQIYSLKTINQAAIWAIIKFAHHIHETNQILDIDDRFMLNDSVFAAGSRFTRWPVLREVLRCVRKELAKVDFPAPAGPITRTA